jgi:fido (protein-threonine AMPylation protein)
MDQKLPPWGFELEEYVREGEPGQAERATAWQTAIGLQAVDGLTPSPYLLATAQDHIAGAITIEEAEQRIASYYRAQAARTQVELESQEADVVSSRIAKILGEPTFSFSPGTWKSIHRQLFAGLLPAAGEYRDYNHSKREWVLKGDTVRYAAWETIKETVDYDFGLEQEFSYRNLPMEAVASHLAKFASGIWQIHPFAEGNTRATAVFIIKYLNSLGFAVNNQPFAEHSWYFRNALVRDNYNNLAQGVTADSSFLELFFRNLLLSEDHPLKNRYLHLDWPGE